MNKRLLTGLAIVASMMGGAIQAQAVVLTFEGVGNASSVGDYYNGGAGGNYGISFVNAYAATEQGAGGSAPYTTEPSRVTSMAFYNTGNGTANSGTMNVSSGFNTNISFYYTSPGLPVTVNVYDGLNGTGTLLATQTLSTYTNYASFVPVTIGFSGTARSVTFGGVNGFPVAYDNISLSPVPEPSAVFLLGTGILAFGWYGRKRKEVEC